MTKEHIFGKAISRLVQSPKPAKVYRGGEQLKLGYPVLNVTAKLLCSACNSGISSKVIGEALPAIRALTKGSLSTLTEVGRVSLRRYCERIALLADVLSSNAQAIEGRTGTSKLPDNGLYRLLPPAVDDSTRQAWASTPFDLNMTAIAGHHNGCLGIDPQVCVRHISLDDSATLVESIRQGAAPKIFSFVIQKLAIIIAIGTELPAIPKSFLNLHESDAASVWPPGRFVSYRDHMETAFKVGPAIEVHLKILDNRRLRARIEEESRRRGEYFVPDDVVRDWRSQRSR